MFIPYHLSFNDSVALSSHVSSFPYISGVILNTLSLRKTGIFKLPKKANLFQICMILLLNRKYMLKTHIRAGSNKKQITDQLNNLPGLTGAMPEFGEGELLATTYNYSFGTSRANFISNAKKNLHKVSDKLWKKYGAKALLTKKDAIILASIVIKEAEIPEYKNIAQVFISRLRKNMRLQACSTVSFALDGKQKLFYTDMLVHSPYNTYRNIGLPPGPICAISQEALESVLKIHSTNEYIFFVKKNQSEHHFSSSYKQHLKVQQKKRY